MTHDSFIPSNLPLYFQCLRVPCEVGTGVHPRYGNFRTLQQIYEPETRERATRLYWDPIEKVQADTYDPWEERGRFFRIKDGDVGSLIDFLQSVGFLQSSALGGDPAESTMLVTDPDGQYHTARYISEIDISTIWATRRMIENSLRDLNKHTGHLIDFTARITLVKGQPKVTITTCTFLDSLLLTLAVDRVQKAKVRKCARPDCRILFSSATAHNRKFCSWNCGHIEAVRNSRKRAKKAKRTRKEL